MEFRIIDHCRWFSSAESYIISPYPMSYCQISTRKIHKMRSYSSQRGVVVISIISSTNQRGDIPRPVSTFRLPGHAIKGQSFENTSHQAFTQLNVTLCFNLCLQSRMLYVISLGVHTHLRPSIFTMTCGFAHGQVWQVLLHAISSLLEVTLTFRFDL